MRSSVSATLGSLAASRSHSLRFSIMSRKPSLPFPPCPPYCQRRAHARRAGRRGTYRRAWLQRWSLLLGLRIWQGRMAPPSPPPVALMPSLLRPRMPVRSRAGAPLARSPAQGRLRPYGAHSRAPWVDLREMLPITSPRPENSSRSRRDAASSARPHCSYSEASTEVVPMGVAPTMLSSRAIASSDPPTCMRRNPALMKRAWASCLASSERALTRSIEGAVPHFIGPSGVCCSTAKVEHCRLEQPGPAGEEFAVTALIFHLGEWHTRPECTPHPSYVDKNLMKQTAENGSCLFDRAFMVILGYDGVASIGMTNPRGNGSFLETVHVNFCEPFNNR